MDAALCLLRLVAVMASYQYPPASELPWGVLVTLVASTIGLHVLGGVIDWLARPSARPPVPPPVAAVAAVTLPVVVARTVPTPASPTALRAPPHRTESELRALLKYLKAGGDLTDSQRRELWDAGVRFRTKGSTPNTAQHSLSTLEIVLPPGYLPQPAPVHQGDSAWDKYRKRNEALCGKMTCP